MEILRSLRAKERFTYQDMANFLGISKAFYWQIENKQRTLSYKMAINIADIFHKKPDDVFLDEFKNKA